MNQIIEATIDGEIIKLEDFSKPETLNVTDAVILKLEKKHTGLKVTDNKELKTVTAARKEVRDLRVAVSKRNKSLKKSLNDAKKSIDAEAERIINKLQAIEDPLDKEIKDYQEEQARIKKEAEAKEAKRIADIQQRITTFENQAKNLHGKTATELKQKLDFFQACVANDVFKYEEFSIQADKVKMQVETELKQAYEAKKTQEDEAARIAEERRKIEEEKAELERQRQELAKKSKVLEPAIDGGLPPASSEVPMPDVKPPLVKPSTPDPIECVKDAIDSIESDVELTEESKTLKFPVYRNEVSFSMPVKNQNSDNKIIIHKQIMDYLLQQGFDYKTAGEFLKLLQAGFIPNVSINYEE